METINLSEYKTVVVRTSTDDSQPPHLIIAVDGAQYPIWRGQPTILPPQAYEVLVNAKESFPFTVVQPH